MTSMTLKYEGEDAIITITRAEIEALGVEPGDEFVLNVDIRPKVELTPCEWAPGEREEMHRILKELHGSWTEEQEAEYRRNRELWNQWKPRE
jgi:hypothetical protein